MLASALRSDWTSSHPESPAPQPRCRKVTSAVSVALWRMAGDVSLVFLSAAMAELLMYVQSEGSGSVFPLQFNGLNHR